MNRKLRKICNTTGSIAIQQSAKPQTLEIWKNGLNTDIISWRGIDAITPTTTKSSNKASYVNLRQQTNKDQREAIKYKIRLSIQKHSKVHNFLDPFNTKPTE